MSSLRVHIPAPCAESWDAMTPTGLGRHCTACQKTVVDFTQKTDAEILAILRQATGSTCGRLRPDQLDRPLVMPTPAPRWRTWVGAALAIGGVAGATQAAAQTALGCPSGYPIPMADIANDNPAAVPTKPTEPALGQARPGGPLVLRGVVTDSATREGLPGVTVILAGTTTGTTTDAMGAFALPVAPDAVSVQLAFSSVGYVGQRLTVSLLTNQSIAISMQGAVLGGMVSGIVVTGVAGPRLWPWHPRRFFNWSSYWLTRPFKP